MKKLNDYYITIVEKTSEYHRSKIIIHEPILFYFAEFSSLEQLKYFSEMLGFTYTLEEEKRRSIYGLIQRFSISHNIIDDIGGGFWNLEDLPKAVKPFKALSNGSIVTCYFLKDDSNIIIYRPNPNAKDVYKPLELTEHIYHKMTYGSY